MSNERRDSECLFYNFDVPILVDNVIDIKRKNNETFKDFLLEKNILQNQSYVNTIDHIISFFSNTKLSFLLNP